MKKEKKELKKAAKADVNTKKKAPKVKTPKEKVPKEKGAGIFSIRTKLSAAFLLPTITFLIAGTIIYQKCSALMITSSENAVTTSVATIAEYVSSGGEAATLIADRLGVDAVTAFSGKPNSTTINEIKRSVANEASADYLVSNIAFIGDGYSSITNSGEKKGDAFGAFDASEAGQYVSSMGGESAWIGKHAELDEVVGFKSGSSALSYIRPFNNRNNKFAGYIVVDIKTEYITDVLNKAELGEGSYVAFIGSDGNEVVSGDGAFTFADKDFYTEIKDATEQGTMTVSVDGKEYMFVYSPVKNVDAVICAVVPRSSILAGAKTIRTALAIACIICAIFALILGNYFSLDIGKTIAKVNNNLKKTSSGDLTTELHLQRKDEFKTLSFNIRNMTASMKTLIMKMSGVSGELMASADTVGDNSATILDMTKNITEAVGYIDEGITRQSEDTANCLEQMEELADKISVVQTNATEINEITNDAKVAIEGGMQVVSELNGHVKETTDVTRGIIDDIANLSKQAQAINGIVSTIEEISEETNLLALNASIEAARAGEAGKGFAVVADNIRGFALRSNEAAGQIGEIIGKLQAQMDVTINTAGKAEEIVNSQEESLKTTIDVFGNIRDHVVNLSGNLESITNSMKGIEKAKEDTLLAIESISSTSVQTSASASELNKTIEKQLEAVEELNHAVTVLQQNASELDEAVGVFKID